MSRRTIPMSPEEIRQQQRTYMQLRYLDKGDEPKEKKAERKNSRRSRAHRLDNTLNTQGSFPTSWKDKAAILAAIQTIMRLCEDGWITHTTMRTAINDIIGGEDA